MAELVSRRKYAEMRGVSHTLVNAWVRDGRIALVDGKIDPEAADAAWPKEQMSLEPRVGSKAEEELLTLRAKRQIVEKRAAAVVGEAVNVAEVREAVGEMISNVRARLLLVPSKLLKFGALVMVEAENEIESALQELSNGVV